MHVLRETGKPRPGGWLMTGYALRDFTLRIL
jgi:hypothetical protein